MADRTIEEVRQDLAPADAAAAEAVNTRAIAMQGFLFAFPAWLHLRQLTEFLPARRMMAPGEPPFGGWVLMRSVSTPKVTTVSPNVDTLYGAAYLSLDQHGPVVLQVPAIPDRYHSVAVHDAFFDIAGMVGTSTSGGEGVRALITGPGWSGSPPSGIDRVIRCPTPVALLHQRIFIRGPREEPAVQALQDAITLTTLEGASFDIDLSPFEHEGLRGTTDPLEYFRLVNPYTGRNLRPQDRGLATLLASAGCGPDAAVPDDPAAQEAIRHGARDAQAAIDARLSSHPHRDGWRLPDLRAALPSQTPLERAATQATQMGALPSSEAVYLFAAQDSASRRLDGSRSYRLRFPAGGFPPIDPRGFWSLTMYDAVTSLLVPNPIDRYAVRPDTPGLTLGSDGSLEIRLQAAAPSGVPEGNWLPTPAGPFTVALRAYLPDDAVLSGTWSPPGIEEIMGE